MSTNDGGPAFPQDGREFTNSRGDEVDYWPPSRGMSLRDWFAGQALAAIIGKNTAREVESGVNDRMVMIANGAYDYADAMLARRKNGMPVEVEA